MLATWNSFSLYFLLDQTILPLESLQDFHPFPFTCKYVSGSYSISDVQDGKPQSLTLGKEKDISQPKNINQYVSSKSFTCTVSAKLLFHWNTVSKCFSFQVPRLHTDLSEGFFSSCGTQRNAVPYPNLLQKVSCKVSVWLLPYCSFICMKLCLHKLFCNQACNSMQLMSTAARPHWLKQQSVLATIANTKEKKSTAPVAYATCSSQISVTRWDSVAYRHTIPHVKKATQPAAYSTVPSRGGQRSAGPRSTLTAPGPTCSPKVLPAPVFAPSGPRRWPFTQMRPQPASRNRQGRQSGARQQRQGTGPAATGPPVGRGVGKSQPPRRPPPPPPHRPDRGPAAAPPRAGRGRGALPPPSRSEAGATANPSAPQPGPTPAGRRGTAAHRSPQLPPLPELGGRARREDLYSPPRTPPPGPRWAGDVPHSPPALPTPRPGPVRGGNQIRRPFPPLRSEMGRGWGCRVTAAPSPVWKEPQPPPSRREQRAGPPRRRPPHRRPSPVSPATGEPRRAGVT